MAVARVTKIIGSSPKSWQDCSAPPTWPKGSFTRGDEFVIVDDGG